MRSIKEIQADLELAMGDYEAIKDDAASAAEIEIVQAEIATLEAELAAAKEADKPAAPAAAADPEAGKAKTPKEKKTREQVEKEPVVFLMNEKCDHLEWVEEGSVPGLYSLKVQPGSRISDKGTIIQTSRKGEKLYSLGADCGRLLFAEPTDFSAIKAGFTKLEKENDNLEKALEKSEADCEANKVSKEVKAAAKVATAAVKELAEVHEGIKTPSQVKAHKHLPVPVELDEVKKWEKNWYFDVCDDDGKVIAKRLTGKEVRTTYGEDVKLKAATVELHQPKLQDLRIGDLKDIDEADRPAQNLTAAQRKAVLGIVDDLRDMAHSTFFFKGTNAWLSRPKRILRQREKGSENKDVWVKLYNDKFISITADGTVGKEQSALPAGKYSVVASERSIKPFFYFDPHNVSGEMQTDCIAATMGLLGKEITGAEYRKMCGNSEPAILYRNQVFSRARKHYKAEKSKDKSAKWSESLKHAVEQILNSAS